MVEVQFGVFLNVDAMHLLFSSSVSKQVIYGTRLSVEVCLKTSFV